MPTYNFSFKAQDASGSSLFGCLGEGGEAILGMKARDLYAIKDDFEALKSINLSK